MAKEWIVLTDPDDLAVRVQVGHILYFRGSDEGGTKLCLGGDGSERLILAVQEDPATIDDLIGGDLLT